MFRYTKFVVLRMLGSTQFHADRSYHAEKELSSNWFDFFGYSAIGTGILLFFGFIFSVGLIMNGHVMVVIGGICFMLIIWFLPLIFGGRSYRRRRIDILEKNEADYEMSQRLNAALEPLSDKCATEYPIIELEIGKPMHPFRVEHHLSSSMRGQITGSISGGLFGLRPSIFTGSMNGLAVPNLVDSSTVLFLTDGESTMRVLLPSPTAVREMMAKILEAHSTKLSYGSHTQRVIRRFALDDDHLTKPVSHPQLIDQLNVKCEDPLQDRPHVSVLGYEIQPGVALASALVVDGEKKMFLPTGFYEALAQSIASVTELEAKMPKTLAIADSTREEDKNHD